MKNIDPQGLIDELESDSVKCLQLIATLDPVNDPTKLARMQGKYGEKQEIIARLRKLAG